MTRLAHPYWFQAFGCVLGFDWHSSGLTTTAYGALKEVSPALEVYVAGGKGSTSRRAAQEIIQRGTQVRRHGLYARRTRLKSRRRSCGRGTADFCWSLNTNG